VPQRRESLMEPTNDHENQGNHNHVSQHSPQHHESWTSYLLSSLTSTSSTGTTVRTNDPNTDTLSNRKISTAQSSILEGERKSRSRTVSSSNYSNPSVIRRPSQDSVHLSSSLNPSRCSSRASTSSSIQSSQYQQTINLLSPPYISSHQYHDQHSQSKLKIGRKANLASSPVPIALSPKVIHPVCEGVDFKTTKEYDSHIKLGKGECLVSVSQSLLKSFLPNRGPI
jgi:hypothetical protein